MKAYIFPHYRSWAIKTTAESLIERFVVMPRLTRRQVVRCLPYYEKLWGKCRIVRVGFRDSV